MFSGQTILQRFMTIVAVVAGVRRDISASSLY